MAQLRDSQTSELIAEGTPLELALIAAELDRDDVLFDDVGEGFDPDAVIAAHRENVDGLAGAAREAKGDERKRLEERRRAAADELELNRARVDEAAAALEAARAQAG